MPLSKMKKYTIRPCFYASCRKQNMMKHCPQSLNSVYTQVCRRNYLQENCIHDVWMKKQIPNDKLIVFVN